MENLHVTVWLNGELVAYAQTDEQSAIAGPSERKALSGIGDVGQENQVLKSAPDTMILSALSFTSDGLKALGNPTNLCQALNGREFHLEVFNSNNASSVKYRCISTSAASYLGTTIDKAPFELLNFSVLADIPMP